MTPDRLVIAMRKSALSQWQAEHVRDMLRATHPACEIVLLGLSTKGDRILDQPLADIGGKGLFVEEIEAAMRRGEADLAVHSLKDMPMEMAEGFTIAAVPAREDPRDALVSDRYPTLDSIPAGAIVGTSSLRREAQLRERNPGLDVRVLRGNVNTRLRKLDEGRYHAIILASAGLTRLGMKERIRAYLEPSQFLPAVGQGALAIECASDRHDVIAAVAPLTHRATLLAVTAERAFSRALSGSCHTPIAGYATFRGGELWLRGLLATREGTHVMRGERAAPLAADRGDAAAAEAMGRALADELIAGGAGSLLAAANVAGRAPEH
ncbi:MAG: hydroxymethylbilane synthase [Burkholderiales bacterium]|nr:hydroxymethylbilane synthase [Burkholderiales bacterium]